MKKKATKKEPEIRQLTPEELAEEERIYQACKKPVKIGWGIFTAATTIYICAGLFTRINLSTIPQVAPPTDTLSEYRETDEYNEFVREAQNEALRLLTNGEITKEEYDQVVSTVSDDKKFEEFLRTLENDERVQKVLENYDKNQEQLRELGRKYSATSIAGLSGLLVASLILGKYRFKEMEIEEAREKRAKALEIQQQEVEL